MARDATARLYDVDAQSVKMDKKAGTIVFQAKKGKLVDLDQLHESIRCTRLGDSTGMTMNRLHVTVQGELALEGNGIVLKVKGTDQSFLLGDAPNERPVTDRLRDAMKQGQTVARISGNVETFVGNLTKLSAKLPDKPRRLLVTDLETSKP